MTSDQPLLASSESPSQNRGSFGCLCRSASFTSSSYDDSQNDIVHVKENCVSPFGDNTWSSENCLKKFHFAI